jgi:hypothetical protein
MNSSWTLRRRLLTISTSNFFRHSVTESLLYIPVTLGAQCYLQSLLSHAKDQSANAKPPLGTATLLQKRKQIRVHDVESAISLALLNHARDVDLAGALRDHLDVDALLSKCAEEATADADHAA